MNQFLKTLSSPTSAVIDPTIPIEQYVKIDLSSFNTELQHFDTTSSREWERYLDNYLKGKQATVAYGGYLEKRNLYQRSKYFSSESSDRNIHLGVDLWIDAGTSVHALTDGEVHSFQDNQNFGDYGPTIILKHETDGQIWHSLYGHLSRESLEGLKVGKKVNSGDQIATLGSATVNGDYAPHLHFQLILDMQNKKGDYPGVCSKDDLAFYRKNCPDPKLVLRLK